jgi:hypothetical protein
MKRVIAILLKCRSTYLSSPNSCSHCTGVDGIVVVATVVVTEVKLASSKIRQIYLVWIAKQHPPCAKSLICKTTVRHSQCGPLLGPGVLLFLLPLCAVRCNITATTFFLVNNKNVFFCCNGRANFSLEFSGNLLIDIYIID